MMQKPLGQENKRRGNREVRGEGEARLGYAGVGAHWGQAEKQKLCTEGQCCDEIRQSFQFHWETVSSGHHHLKARMWELSFPSECGMGARTLTTLLLRNGCRGEWGALLAA